MRGGKCAEAFTSTFIKHKSPEQLVVFAVMLASGVLAQILLSANTNTLASLDQGIAGWAQSLSGENDSDYEKGLVNFLNETLEVVVVIFGAILVLALLYDLFIIKMRFKAYLEHYLYMIIGIAVTLVLSFGTLCIMKTAFNRPRPWQTEEFHRLDATDEQCWAKFWPAYRTYPE